MLTMFASLRSREGSTESLPTSGRIKSRNRKGGEMIESGLDGVLVLRIKVKVTKV